MFNNYYDRYKEVNKEINSLKKELKAIQNTAMNELKSKTFNSKDEAANFAMSEVIGKFHFHTMIIYLEQDYFKLLTEKDFFCKYSINTERSYSYINLGGEILDINDDKES